MIKQKHRLSAAVPVLAATALLTISGCSGSGSTSPTSSSTNTSSSSASASASLKTLTAEQVTVKDPNSNNPTMEFPVPSRASQLSTKDLTEGKGAAATPNSTVTVDYLGQGALNGKVFDSSFESGKTATFPLKSVIPGWTQGLTGVKAGGERVLVIPADLAYGAEPPPGSGIMPDETLVFYVKVAAITG